MASATPGQGGLGVRKQAGQALWNKPVGIVPPWPALGFCSRFLVWVPVLIFFKNGWWCGFVLVSGLSEQQKTSHHHPPPQHRYGYINKNVKFPPRFLPLGRCLQTTSQFTQATVGQWQSQPFLRLRLNPEETAYYCASDIKCVCLMKSLA